jgi:ribonuclease HI
MYCSFDSKYNAKSQKLVLSFFVFNEDRNSLYNYVIERQCEELKLQELYFSFLDYMIDTFVLKFNKLRFILPKTKKDNLNEYYEILKCSPIDLKSYINKEIRTKHTKIIVEEYRNIEYSTKEFLAERFINISKHNKYLVSQKELLSEVEVYDTSSLDNHYVALTKDNIPDDFFDQYITIFTDASFNNNNNLYGWAGWIKTNTNTYRISGWDFCKDNHHAEMHAIDLTLKHLIKIAPENNINLNNKIISLTTDSDKSISIIDTLNKKERYTHNLASLKEKILNYGNQNLFTLKLKGIKSHTNSESKRTSVNTWCDNEAKKKLNEAIAYTGKNDLTYTDSHLDYYVVKK